MEIIKESDDRGVCVELLELRPHICMTIQVVRESLDMIHDILQVNTDFLVEAKETSLRLCDRYNECTLSLEWGTYLVVDRRSVKAYATLDDVKEAYGVHRKWFLKLSLMKNLMIRCVAKGMFTFMLWDTPGVWMVVKRKDGTTRMRVPTWNGDSNTVSLKLDKGETFMFVDEGNNIRHPKDVLHLTPDTVDVYLYSEMGSGHGWGPLEG